MMDGGSLVCVKVLDGGTEAVWVCARAVYHVCPWLLYLGAHVCSSCLVLSCLCAWLRGGPARHPLGRGDERGAQEGLRAHALLNIPILFYKVSGGAQSSGVNISVFSIV